LALASIANVADSVTAATRFDMRVIAAMLAQ
jgi:hypothetical protein